MERRTVLRGLGAATAAGLAGCLGAGSPADDPEEPTDTPTPSPPTSPSPAPGGSVADTEFRLTDGGSGDTVDDATVTVGDPVTVTGTVWGSNGCHTAELADATLVDGTLTVVVRAYEPETDTPRACTDAIVELDYEATVDLEGAAPSTVVVVHERGGERTEVARVDGG